MAQIRQNNEFYETHGLVTSDGELVTTENPLPVTLGSENITITGSVNVGSTVEVISSPENPVHVHVTEITEVEVKNDTGNPIPVTLSEELTTLYTFNNFGAFTHRGWTMSDTLIPMLSIRAKTGTTNTAKLLEYELGNNNANQSTVGYVWVENATITGTTPSWTSLNSDVEYRFYTDAYGSNTPNGFTGGTQRHSGIIIGKNSSAEEEMKDISMVSGGVTLTLCVMRLDSGTKLDLWFAATVGVS